VILLLSLVQLQFVSSVREVRLSLKENVLRKSLTVPNKDLMEFVNVALVAINLLVAALVLNYQKTAIQSKLLENVQNAKIVLF